MCDVRNENGGCTFALFGEEINIEGISTLLGVQPTRCWQAGDVYLSGGKEMRRSNGVWSISSTVISSNPLDHFSQITNHVWRLSDANYKNLGIDSARMSLLILKSFPESYGPARSAEIILPYNAISLLASLHADLSICAYIDDIE